MKTYRCQSKLVILNINCTLYNFAHLYVTSITTIWEYNNLQVNRTFGMPRVAFLSSFLFHLKFCCTTFAGVHQEEKLLLLLSMTVRLIQSRSRLAARAKGVRFRLLECSSAARLLPCTVGPAAWQPLCCAAFELPTKEKLLHCLQALTTYGLQLVMHLTCTHSHTLTLTHIHTYIYVCMFANSCTLTLN